MKQIGPIIHPVKLLNEQVVNFNFEYFETNKGRYAVAYLGNIKGEEDVLLRIESSCIFGHVFGVVRCDCQYQLAQAMQKVANEGKGIVVYAIDQDGRGLGIDKHFEIYVLRQQENLETEGVYERLKTKPDVREYDDVLDILKYYDIKGVKLMTNNPRRLKLLENANIKYERIPLEITLNNNNSGCLMDEKKDLGYLFSFNTHEEWFTHMKKNKLGKENDFQACLITCDFKNIVSEEYNVEYSCMNTIKKATSNISHNLNGLKAYLIGNIDDISLQILKEKNIKQIYCKSNETECNMELCSKYAINVEFV